MLLEDLQDIRDDDTPVLRSVLLALGDYDPSACTTWQRDHFIRIFTALHREHPDAGVHGLARWALGRWNVPIRFEENLEWHPTEFSPCPRRNWRDRGDGRDMVRIPAARGVLIGSSPEEPGFRPGERRRRVDIERDFALATHEVTRGEFHLFLEQTGEGTRPDHLTTFSNLAD